MQHYGDSTHRKTFACLLLLLIWLPLPMGSKPFWAISALEIWVYGLAVATLMPTVFGRRFQKTPALSASLPLLAPIAALALWFWIQQLPLPFALVQLLSPNAANAWAAVHPGGNPEWISLSLDPYHTIRDARLTLAYLALVAVALTLVNSAKRLRLLAATIILSGAIQGLYGSLATLLEVNYCGYRAGSTARSCGTFINANSYAAYLYLCLSVGIGWLIAESKSHVSWRGWRAWLRNISELLLSNKAPVRILLCVMCIGLVMSHSRMGNTAFFASLTITGLLALVLQRKHVTRGIVIMFLSLILIDILIVGGWFGLDKVVDRIEQTVISNETVIELDEQTGEQVERITQRRENRVDIDLDTVPMWKDYILTGSGAGSFYSVFPRYAGPNVGGFAYDAHNDYIQFAIEFGLIGMLPMGFLVIYGFYISLRTQATRHNALSRGVAFSCTMAMIALVFHSGVDYVLQFPANASLILILITMAHIGAHQPSKSGKKKRRKAASTNADMTRGLPTQPPTDSESAKPMF